MVNPELGFTSDVIKDPKRFVGRYELIRTCIRAINSSYGLIAIYGKRGVGKSSLLRQIQQMALGDYTLAEQCGMRADIPEHPRKYFTVYYTCDSSISGGSNLLKRLSNDQDAEDGLLRLVPNEGKEIVEFTRAKEVSAGADLKVINWGAKGIESSKYARVVPGDEVQTFRNFVNAIITHQVRKHNRDGLLILLDEFDVIQDKQGIGSLIKSLTSEEVKFGICGIGRDLIDLVEDHASVERLLEQGAINVRPMNDLESQDIINRAEKFFQHEISFWESVKKEISEASQGYPYFVQMLGKECVVKANHLGKKVVDSSIFNEVLQDIKDGRSFPTLESQYQRAIGGSDDRQFLLHLFADQKEDEALFNETVGRLFLKRVRKEAVQFEVQNIDQVLPRLIERKYGPALVRVDEKPGIYEFANPVFRLYVRLRNF